MKIYPLPGRKPSLKNERGQSLVEVALVIPALLILFLGIAELGFYLYTHIQVANATREGARYGSLCRLNNNCAAVMGPVVWPAVVAEAQALKMTSSNTRVTVQPSPLSIPPATGTPITVTVIYTFTSPFISNFVPMFPVQIPIQHTIIMQFDR